MVDLSGLYVICLRNGTTSSSRKPPEGPIQTGPDGMIASGAVVTAVAMRGKNRAARLTEFRGAVASGRSGCANMPKSIAAQTLGEFLEPAGSEPSRSTNQGWVESTVPEFSEPPRLRRRESYEWVRLNVFSVSRTAVAVPAMLPAHCSSGHDRDDQNRRSNLEQRTESVWSPVSGAAPSPASTASGCGLVGHRSARDRSGCFQFPLCALVSLVSASIQFASSMTFQGPCKTGAGSVVRTVIARLPSSIRWGRWNNM